jgi:acetylornithine/succinyldiaminopimelate/putrescine aminotransferase
MELLRERCDAAGALLVADEIFCGLGRTGVMWRSGELADVVLTGKALGHGLPISAALFRNDLEQAWDLGPQDVYTHTHVGNPLACAAALVVLAEVPRLLDRVRAAGERFEDWQGEGLMRARPGDAKEAERRGVIVAPAGEGLIQATPPLTISDDEIDRALDLLGD